ncbi:MAG: replication initiation factor domain-containing protein [Oscillospiraceae bacterium]
MGILLYDWLSFTSKIDSPDSIILFLGLENIKFTQTFGFHGYKQRYLYQGISIHFDGFNSGVWVEMSGEGCRAFEEFATTSWEVIFHTIRENTGTYNITRLDVAYDDKENILDIDLLYRETDAENFTSKFQCVKLEKEVKKKAITIYYGSQSSRIMFRCYDKAKERQEKGKEYSGHWVRFEIQLRDERAFSFIEQIAYIDIGTLFIGIVVNYLRYIVPTNDSHKSRAKTTKYWHKFVDDAKKISLYTPCDTEYNLSKAKQYVFTQPSNAIDTIIKIDGVDKFLRDLRANKPRLSEKYMRLLIEHEEDVKLTEMGYEPI